MSKWKYRRQKNLEQHCNKTLNAIASCFFVGITAVHPLFLTRRVYSIITFEKTLFFYVLTGVAAAAVVGSILVFSYISGKLQPNNYYIEDEPKHPISISEWALLAFLLLTLLSAIFSPWQEVVWTGFTTGGFKGRWEGFWAFLCYGLSFLIIGRLYNPKRRHLIIFASSVIIVSLIGILQFLGFSILMNQYQTNRFSITFITTLGNSNVVAAYCSFVTMLFAALFTGENSKWSTAYIAASSLSFALLLISGGRGAMVGMFGAMVLLLPYWISNRTRLGKICAQISCWCIVSACYHGYISSYKRSLDLSVLSESDLSFLNAFNVINPLLFIAFAAVLVAAGLFITLRIKTWPERLLKIIGTLFVALSIVGCLLFVEIVGANYVKHSRNIVWQAREMMHGRIQDSFGSGRGWVWKNGLQVIGDNPLLGTGPDTFFYALEERQPEAAEILNEVFDKAHNTFLQIAVCMGLPALIAYLIFLGGLFVPSIKSAFERPVLFSFVAASLSYLIQCFFQVDTPIDRPILWVALGVIAVELWLERIKA